jgi:hypothetical protein
MPSLCGNPLGAPIKTKFPAGASANRAAAPAPNPGYLPQTKMKSEEGRIFSKFFSSDRRR